MPARMRAFALSADVSKGIRNRSSAAIFVRLVPPTLDDIQMNPAAARAAHGPVFGAAAAGDDAQDRERRAAVRAVGQRRRCLQDPFGLRDDLDGGAAYVASRGMKRSMCAFASAIAASGFDHAKPTSSAGNDRPSMTTGAWSVR